MYSSFRKRKLHKYVNFRNLLLLIIWIALYNEFVSYFVDKLFWYNLKCESSDDKFACTRILLVADPQIIGEYNGNAIEIWDSDRYLYYSYQQAVSHFNPDVIVFLGDLMDEGSISSNDQYYRYLKRFEDIFLNYPAQFIYVPGDNDIGGEFGDWITPAKIYRFEQILSKNQSTRIDYGETLSFYKVNRLVQQYPHKVDMHKNMTRIVISHLQLMRNGYIDGTVEKIKPHVIFSGDKHTPSMCDWDPETQDTIFTDIDLNRNKVYTIDFTLEKIYEIVVPTCSYRMGVMHMGYGAAVLDANKQEMRYTIFWLHGRFPILFFYLFLVVLVLFKCLCSFCKRNQSNVSYLKL